VATHATFQRVHCTSQIINLTWHDDMNGHEPRDFLLFVVTTIYYNPFIMTTHCRHVFPFLFSLLSALGKKGNEEGEKERYPKAPFRQFTRRDYAFAFCATFSISHDFLLFCSTRRLASFPFLEALRERQRMVFFQTRQRQRNRMRRIGRYIRDRWKVCWPVMR
jgi:hypothetical protein